MRNKYSKIFKPILLLGLLSFAALSCRQEETITTDNKNEIKSNSELALLIERTAMHDGSVDNIVDMANCFSVKLPVTVIIEDITITLTSEADYETLAALKEEEHEEELTFVFPITILLADYTEVKINDISELETYRGNCNGEDEYDEDIECLDFNYPIKAITYTALADETNIITIENDQQMYYFIEDLENFDTVTIDFPIYVTLFDGTEETVNTIDELTTLINNVADQCDEDDDYEYDDD